MNEGVAPAFSFLAAVVAWLAWRSVRKGSVRDREWRDAEDRAKRTGCLGTHWRKEWIYPRESEWDRLDRRSTIVVADLPCGGFLFAGLVQDRLEDAAADEKPDGRLRFKAFLWACPKAKRGEFRRCPVRHNVRNGAWTMIDVIEDRNPVRHQPDATHLEWRLAGVPYFKLPPYEPLPREFDLHHRPHGPCPEPATVLNAPAPDLKRLYAERNQKATDGGDGGDEGDQTVCIHAGESSTRPDAKQPGDLA